MPPQSPPAPTLGAEFAFVATTDLDDEPDVQPSETVAVAVYVPELGIEHSDDVPVPDAQPLHLIADPGTGSPSASEAAALTGELHEA